MRTCNTCNKEKSLDSFYKDKTCKDGHHKKCKICHKSYIKKHYLENKDYYQNYKKQYNEENKKELKLHGKVYYNINKTQIQTQNKLYNIKNQKNIKVYNKMYNEKNKEEIIKYRQGNRDKSNTWQKNYNKNNKEVVTWRNLLYRVLGMNGNPKSNSTYKMLGYTHKELKLHLDNQGMDWNTHTVDHKVPVSWFKRNTPPNIVNSLYNLQPLTEAENKSKSNKFSSPISGLYFNQIRGWIKEEYLNKLV